METTAEKIVRKYGIIAAFTVIAGVTAAFISQAELEHAPALTKDNWPEAELHVAASAALNFKKDQGRLPESLDELRDSPSAQYLPKDFDLKGVMYFRESDGRQRLSWRDDVDGAVAYCSIDAATRERC